MDNFTKRRPQDDIPYEQQMKHIIEHYRILLRQNDELKEYCRKLEHSVRKLNDSLSEKAYKNAAISRKNIEKNRENKRIKAHSEWVESQLREYRIRYGELKDAGPEPTDDL